MMTENATPARKDLSAKEFDFVAVVTVFNANSPIQPPV
jgi:hypothetical protein